LAASILIGSKTEAKGRRKKTVVNRQRSTEEAAKSYMLSQLFCAVEPTKKKKKPKNSRHGQGKS